VNVPGVLKVFVNTCPLLWTAEFGPLPENVTLCAAAPRHVHVTVLPAVIVTVAGE
jgi:hypothetical protein